MPVFQPNSSATIRSTKSHTLIGNNTTVNVPLFRVTGIIEVKGLHGTVTTVIGANHTASLFRLNDQTAQVAISAAAGTALSAAAVGTWLGKVGLAAAATNVQTAAAGRILEPTTLETLELSEFLVVAKNGANTDIEYQYATTDAPTTGVINFVLDWIPLSASASVTAQ